MDSGAEPDEWLVWAQRGLVGITLATCWGSEGAAWTLARAFTEQREREIAEIEEEIKLQQIVIDEAHESCGVEGCGCEEPYGRTKKRLEAIRDDLRRGMK